MKTNYLFIGMAALMIAACSNNENEPQVDDGRIAVSFAGEITLPRATTDTWEANDGIGIYMLEHGMKTVTDGATNRKYVTTAGDGKFTPAGTEQTIYFPLNADEKVDFIAYYPQTDLTGGTVLTWPVEADRTFEQGKKTVFTITLKRTPVGTEVEVNATIQPWDTQGTVSGDLEI